MSVALADTWTAEGFLHWVASQDGRYEFDGAAPVGMVGSTNNHNRIARNLLLAVQIRLRGTGCEVFGLESGLKAGRSVRFPDALITCTRQPGTARLVTDVRVVFEVLSPSTARTDRLTKVREYAAVPSIARYVLIESRPAVATVLHRTQPGEPWATSPLGIEDTLTIPEAGIEFPLAELYEGVDFPPETDDTE